MKHFMLAALVLAFFARPAAGQETVVTATPAAVPTEAELQERQEELTTWLAKYRKWEAWYIVHANVLADNIWGHPVGKRRPRPEPPGWLAAECPLVIAAEGALQDACGIVKTWDLINLWVVERRRLDSGVTYTGSLANDQVEKSSFLRKVHVAGAWIPSEVPMPKMYGVAGVMVGIVEVKRLTLPTVGVFMVRLRSGLRQSSWSAATSLGVSYRVFDFPLPKSTKMMARFHINLANLTVHSVVSKLPVPVSTNQAFVGGSLTFRPVQ